MVYESDMIQAEDRVDHPSNPMILNSDEVSGWVVNEKVGSERRVGNEGRFSKAPWCTSGDVDCVGAVVLMMSV